MKSKYFIEKLSKPSVGICNAVCSDIAKDQRLLNLAKDQDDLSDTFLAAHDQLFEDQKFVIIFKRRTESSFDENINQDGHQIIVFRGLQLLRKCVSIRTFSCN